MLLTTAQVCTLSKSLLAGPLLPFWQNGMRIGLDLPSKFMRGMNVTEGRLQPAHALSFYHFPIENFE